MIGDLGREETSAQKCKYEGLLILLNPILVQLPTRMEFLGDDRRTVVGELHGPGEVPDEFEHEGRRYVPSALTVDGGWDTRTHQMVPSDEVLPTGPIFGWVSIGGITKEGEPYQSISDWSPGEPVLESTVDKSTREQFIVEAFLGAYGITGATLRPGGDPPDVAFDVDKQSHEVELVQLTLDDVRVKRAHRREVERAIMDALDPTGRHAHLQGRIVGLYFHSTLPPRRDYATFAAVVAELLDADAGVQQWDVDESGKILDPESGHYPSPPGAWLYAQAGPNPLQPVQVQIRPDAQLLRRAAIDLLLKAIEGKDVKENQTLLVSVGAPTSDRTIQEQDGALQLLLQHEKISLRRRPKYLSAIYLHAWQEQNYVEIYRDERSTFPRS